MLTTVDEVYNHIIRIIKPLLYFFSFIKWNDEVTFTQLIGPTCNIACLLLILGVNIVACSVVLFPF